MRLFPQRRAKLRAPYYTFRRDWNRHTSSLLTRVLARLLALVALVILPGCAWVKNKDNQDFVKKNHAPVTGAVGGALMAQKLGYLKPEFLAAGLVAYAIYDPLAPTWKIQVIELDDRHRRIKLDMKRLTTGGDGEARRVFTRVARDLAEKNGFAGYDELRYEEGIESTRPFAHRVVEGEIRLLKSQTFPEF